MPERVYECSKAESEELKKALSYDPFLDTNTLPPQIKPADPANPTPEEKAAMEERERQVAETLRKLESSPKGRIIFARQEYSLRDGASVGLNKDMVYLFLSAPEDFIKGAEERFSTEFKTIRRAQEAEEDKVIGVVKEEEEKANAGFGSIFGG